MFIVDDFCLKRIDFYEKMIEEYREAVHRTFFGTEPDYFKQTKVVNRPTEDEVKELFFKGKVL